MINEFPAEKVKELFGITTETLKGFGLSPRDGEKKGRYTTQYYDHKEVLSAWHEYKNKLEDKFVVTPSGEEIDRSLEEAMYVRSRRIAQDMKNEISEGTQIPNDAAYEVIDSYVGESMSVLSSFPLEVKRAMPEVSSALLNQVDGLVKKLQNNLMTLKNTEIKT